VPAPVERPYFLATAFADAFAAIARGAIHERLEVRAWRNFGSRDALRRLSDRLDRDEN
jgi:hypothetical protein